MSGGYQEFRTWSPTQGDYISRISMFDARGSEFFMTIQAGEGRSFREHRAEAVSLIAEAIELGLNPGEVRAI